MSAASKSVDAARAMASALEAVAADHGVRLTWLTLPRPPALSDGCGDLLAASLATLSLIAVSRPLEVVFVLGGDARPSRAVTGGPPPAAEGVVAACRLEEDGGDQACACTPVRFDLDDLSRPDADGPLYRGRLRRLLARLSPVWLDVLRQGRTDRLNRGVLRHLTRLRGDDRTRPPARFSADRSEARRPVAIIAMHWLAYGGAEAFGLACIEAAAAAGFEVIVVADMAGRQHLVSQARRWARHVYLLGEVEALASPDALFRGLVERHRPALLHIHHAGLAYAALPWIREQGFAGRVVDSNHILEHRTGGFVTEAIRHTDAIDRHHVVSEHLRRIFVETGRIPPEKVALGKLHDLSRHLVPQAGKWSAPTPLRVAFVGRFTQQKRPFLFIEVAAQLQRRHGRDAFRFTMVGSGEMRPYCVALAERKGLDDAVLSFLPGSAGAAGTLAEAHVLLVPSDNEGLTLVAFEAIRADCLVISSDVGAQGEIVLRDLLVPRSAPACVAAMVRAVERIRAGQWTPGPLLAAQRRLLEANVAVQTGLEACGYGPPSALPAGVGTGAATRASKGGGPCRQSGTGFKTGPEADTQEEPEQPHRPA